jgi:ABC-type spermidine/putrescine transport system permease subunit I
MTTVAVTPPRAHRSIGARSGAFVKRHALTVYALLGTPQQAMIGNVIQSKFLESLDYPSAAALSFILMGLILVALLVYARIVGSERLTG